MSPSRSIHKRAARRQIEVTFASIAALGTLLATPACAHGFGQRYDLPIPLSFYLVGTAAAVFVTFVIVGLVIRSAARSDSYPRLDLLATGLGRWVVHPLSALVLKLITAVVFIVVIAAGFWGDQNPYRNISPTMLWIIGLVGFAYVSAFIGNLWPLINPWRTIFDAVETIYQKMLGGRALSLGLAYPKLFGIWPAFVLLMALSWFELVYPNPAVPRFLGWLATIYSLLTLTGMFLFGPKAWLQNGEVFGVIFGNFGRFAPIELRTGEQRGLWLRPFGAGLLDSRSTSTSMMAFVLLQLSSVLYDGALGTPEWGSFESAVATDLSTLGDYRFLLIRTAGLVAFWLVFFGAYLGISTVMRLAIAERITPLVVARSFALTLIPIAIGYHLAHYLTFMLVQGQYIIPLVSDPFGFGWNLFGTAGYRVNIAIVDARFAWYAAVTAILIGHIAAVYLAHIKAIDVFNTRSAVLRSQVPLTALMVIYTFVSLSILAEPMVERRAPAPPSAVNGEISIPEDAVLPELGSGRLLSGSPDKLARQKLTYRLLGSAFHDGTAMNAVDVLYSYMFAYRWGARGADQSSHYDPLVASATELMRARLVGVRIVGTDTASKSFRFGDNEFVRELFNIEVYTSTPAMDAEQDAVIAPPLATLPWHLVVLMEGAVERGWAAFSQDEATRRNVDWLDLVRSDIMSKRLIALVEDFERNGYRPDRLKSLVSIEDARKRWAALAAFYKTRGHFLVTNGPYELKRWSADSVTLEAFRDISYPLGVGSFDAYAMPRRGYITSVERDGDRIKLAGDIELISKHGRSYDIVRKPLQSVAPDMITSSSPECRYIVTDSYGRVMLAGQVAIGSDKSFAIDFDGQLPAGHFTLAAEIIVSGNAMNAEIRKVPIDVASNR